MEKRIVSLDDAQVLVVLEELVGMARVDPATHAYLAYDMVHQPRRITGAVVVGRSGVAGYAFLWRGVRSCAIHLWGEVGEELVARLAESAVDCRAVYIHVHSGGLLRLAEEAARTLSPCRRYTFADMVVDRRSFRPAPEPRGATARLLDEGDADELLRLWRERGEEVDPSVAREVLAESLYIGVFVDNRLVSTAAAIVRLRDAWIVADVYTSPAYRRRGYATYAVGELTRRALEAGVEKLALHVRVDNEAALRVYRRLGYRETARKTWLVCRPRSGDALS